MKGSQALLAGVAVLGMVGVASGVEVHITTVRATERGSSDAQLIEIRPRLRRLVGYRSFRVVGEQRQSCRWKNPAAFRIPGGRELRVVPIGMRDDTVLLQIQLMQGNRRLVDTDVRLQNKGVMLLGVEHDARSRALIIMVRAEE